MMALPPPAFPIRRTARGVIPARSRAPKTSSFPILPAAAATLILLGAAQVMLWWWDSRLPDSPETMAARKQNPFVALPQAIEVIQNRPKREAEAVRSIQRLRVMPLAQNLQFGDAMGMVTVTIFTDPSCGVCREQVQRVMASVPVKGVRQVYKFWPQDSERLTPGLLVELARQRGIVGAFWRSIQGAGSNDLDDARLLNMLDSAGVPLSEQRTALTEDGRSLAMSLEPDIAQAKDANLPAPPVFVVDDMVLDGQLLNPQFLNDYVQKRLEGRQIFESRDLFLMDKS